MGTTAFSTAPTLQLVASNGSAPLVRHPSSLTRSPSGLRILRAFEPGACPASAGRMVISGSMADVCAELDRLTRAQAVAH